MEAFIQVLSSSVILWVVQWFLIKLIFKLPTLFTSLGHLNHSVDLVLLVFVRQLLNIFTIIVNFMIPGVS